MLNEFMWHISGSTTWRPKFFTGEYNAAVGIKYKIQNLMTLLLSSWGQKWTKNIIIVITQWESKDNNYARPKKDMHQTKTVGIKRYLMKMSQ